jgi:hypothetical protein
MLLKDSSGTPPQLYYLLELDSRGGKKLEHVPE